MYKKEKKDSFIRMVEIERGDDDTDMGRAAPALRPRSERVALPVRKRTFGVCPEASEGGAYRTG